MKNSRKAQKHDHRNELTIPKQFVVKQIAFIINLNNPSFKHYTIDMTMKRIKQAFSGMPLSTVEASSTQPLLYTYKTDF